MALLTSEIQRIRYELGYNVVSIANPYLTTVALFESVIQQYLQSGATTTSNTSVVASPVLPAPTIVAITLASATGISAGDILVVDVDDFQERATIRSLAGSVASVALRLAHSGTYPVTVEGGETIARQILRQLAVFTGEAGDDGLSMKAAKATGVKKVDEIEFFSGLDSGTNKGRFESVAAAREYFREELASALGVVYLRKFMQASAQTDIAVH